MSRTDKDRLLYCYAVEGKTDEDKLKKLGVKLIVKTGGKYIKHDVISLLKGIAQKRTIVVFTDPDGPGIRIRERLQDELKGARLLIAKSRKALSTDGKKMGVAQMAMPDLKDVLTPYLEHDNAVQETNPWNLSALLECGLTGVGSEANKQKLMAKLGIFFYDSKEAMAMLWMLDLTVDEVKKSLEE